MRRLFLDETAKRVCGIVDHLMKPVKSRRADRPKRDESQNVKMVRLSNGSGFYDKSASDIWRHSRASISTGVLGSVRRARDVRNSSRSREAAACIIAYGLCRAHLPRSPSSNSHRRRVMPVMCFRSHPSPWNRERVEQKHDSAACTRAGINRYPE